MKKFKKEVKKIVTELKEKKKKHIAKKKKHEDEINNTDGWRYVMCLELVESVTFSEISIENINLILDALDGKLQSDILSRLKEMVAFCIYEFTDGRQIAKMTKYECAMFESHRSLYKGCTDIIKRLERANHV